MRPVQRISLTCECCGNDFQRLPCQVTRGRGRFCSRDCSNKAMRRGTEKTCGWCGEAFYKQKAEHDSSAHFCSTAHYNEWRDANRGDTYRRQGQDHVHRLVASEALGRPLRPDEVVHHMDENKLNNDVNNLAVFPHQSHHARCHKGGMSLDELSGYALKNGAPKL